MSAREAYIAGRSGGKKPKSSAATGSPGSSSQRQQQENREQQAFDTGQQERQRAQTIKEEGVAGLPQREQEQAKKIAEITGKDPYKVLPQPDKSLSADITKTISNMANVAQGSLVSATVKLLTYPRPKQFINPNDLSILRDHLKGTDLKNYWNKWKDIISEGMGKDTDFEKFKNAIDSASPTGVQGEESQFRLDPESYYDRGLYETSGERAAALEDYPKFLSDMGLSPVSSRFANMVGNLEDIAGIAITDDMSGPFRQKIFDARAELDRQKYDQGIGGGAGIAGLAGAPSDLVQQPIDRLISLVNPTAAATAATTTPAATATTTAAATPTPFDYSQWPQYAATNQYPWPNYVNQGLGQGPQFDYWNQIARTYPGMS